MLTGRLAHVHHQGGLTYLIFLFLIAALGAGSAAIGVVWQHLAQRDREAELLSVGNEYRRAIERFWLSEAETTKRRLPINLDELIEDKRAIPPRRHLRRHYIDPITGNGEWGVVRQNNGIVGIHSLSEAQPIKSGAFLARDSLFADKKRYSDWIFVARIPNITTGSHVNGSSLGKTFNSRR